MNKIYYLQISLSLQLSLFGGEGFLERLLFLTCFQTNKFRIFQGLLKMFYGIPWPRYEHYCNLVVPVVRFLWSDANLLVKHSIGNVTGVGSSYYPWRWSNLSSFLGIFYPKRFIIQKHTLQQALTNYIYE